MPYSASMISFLTIILGLALAGVFGGNGYFTAIIAIGIAAWLLAALTASAQS
jgi:hypothetical protein